MCLVTIIFRQVNFFWHVPVADESQTRRIDGTIMCYFDCLFSISAPWWMFPAFSWRVFGPNVLKRGGVHGQIVPPVILRFEVKREGEGQKRCGGELIRFIDSQLHCSAAQLQSVIHHSPLVFVYSLIHFQNENHYLFFVLWNSFHTDTKSMFFAKTWLTKLCSLMDHCTWRDLQHTTTTKPSCFRNLAFFSRNFGMNKPFNRNLIYSGFLKRTLLAQQIQTPFELLSLLA